MPLEATLPTLEERITELNAQFQHHSALSVLEYAVTDPMLGPIALVSSFGADAAVLLHMVAVTDRSLPVLFLDTGLHFPETLAYRDELTRKLGLSDVRTLQPDRQELFRRDPDGVLHIMDADACCTLRKAEPLRHGLEAFDAWITGRKRYQGGMRAGLNFFEADGGRIKVNPLAHWDANDVEGYLTNNRLPRHPHVAGGFASIGCAPCSSTGQAREGRWPGQEKSECGIHFLDGRALHV